jgi:chlorite dismutase
MTDHAPHPTSADADARPPSPARYAVWTVYERTGATVDDGRAIADLEAWEAALAATDALRGFRRTAAGPATRLAWSVLGSHRAAEFSRDHVPSFMLGTQPKAWLCVYPFVRSYDWYLLPAEERGGMLREHGLAGRAYAGVQANTVSAFALNDYEWILALEADDLNELVDLMRGLRATEARRHVREEVPFHTGRRVTWLEALEVLR